MPKIAVEMRKMVRVIYRNHGNQHARFVPARRWLEQGILKISLETPRK